LGEGHGFQERISKLVLTSGGIKTPRREGARGRSLAYPCQYLSGRSHQVKKIGCGKKREGKKSKKMKDTFHRDFSERKTNRGGIHG